MHALARRNPSQTDTAASRAAFRRWFGASKVVDAKGEPLAVYHGTTAGGFDAFRPNYRKGEQLGFGIHFAQDRNFAAKYAEDPTVARKGKTPKVYAVYLSIQRPLVADAIVYEGTPEFALAKKLAGSKLMTQRGEDGVRLAYMQNAIDKTSALRAEKLIREAGYDGILYESVLSTASWTGTGVGRARTGSSRSFIVFDPSQVKSATDNAGTFDPAEPSIYRNPAPRNPMRRRNPSDLERALTGDKNLAGANLKDANLKDARLYYATLKGANLVDANLEGADLASAYLVHANLEGANLEGANLMGANLSSANLVRANLRSANLLGANLEGANLEGADLQHAKLVDAKLRSANLAGANLLGADLWGANLRSANLAGADLSGANLDGANLRAAYLERANLTDANLTDANLKGANLGGANLAGADLRRADLTGANLEGANLKRTILEKPPVTRPARSFGRQTGAVLKMGKPDSPAKAADFKRRYPAEAERLKGDTQGRDFSEPLRTQVRQKYATPFEWLVTEGTYDSATQRLCPDPNLVYKFNLDLTDPTFTERQQEFLKRLAENSRRSGHPYEKKNLFTVGWVRLCVNDGAETWLVEEIQSDVGIVRTKLKDGTAPAGLEGYEDVIVELRPYIDRFYEDALGIVFIEAEKKGYGVEMLEYEAKKAFKSPRGIYEDLPRSMGMQKRPKSAVLGERVAETWFYKPNPSRGRR